MSTFAIQQSTQVLINGAVNVIKRKLDDSTWQLEESKTMRITEYSHEDLQKKYVLGELVFVDGNLGAVRDQKLGGVVYEDLDTEDWEKAKVMRAYVLAVMDVKNTEADMKSKIQELWNEIKLPKAPPYWTTVFRWKKKYQASDGSITALVANIKKRGNRNKRYPAKVMELVEKAIEDVYLTREQGNIQNTLEKAITLVENENKLRPALMQLPEPTRNFVKRIIDAMPAFDVSVARNGRSAAIKEFNSVKRHRTTSAPLERVEIDHTPLDIFILDENGNGFGRAYATVCVDDYTRCILGLHISVEPPSYLTVAKCLKNAFLPKVNLKEEYPEIVHDWDCYGVMRELVVDNATEFHSASLEKVCADLGVEIHFSPFEQAWFKGKIERAVGSMNRAVAHGIPGTTFSNIFDKGDYDPQKHAVLRYSTLQLIARKWVVDVYHQKPHKGLGDVPPAVVWQKSIRPEDIYLPADLLRLDAILGRSENRQLTHKGIELYGLLYNSQEMAHLRRQLGSTLNVEIRVDETDLGSIVVLSPDKKTVFHVPALEFKYANGLSAFQHKTCKRYAKLQWGEFDPKAWMKGKREIAELIELDIARKKSGSRNKRARYQGDAALQKSRSDALKQARDFSDQTLDQGCETDNLFQNDHLIEVDALAGTPPIVVVKKLKAIVRQRDHAAMPKDVFGGLPNE